MSFADILSMLTTSSTPRLLPPEVIAEAKASYCIFITTFTLPFTFSSLNNRFIPAQIRFYLR